MLRKSTNGDQNKFKFSIFELNVDEFVVSSFQLNSEN